MSKRSSRSSSGTIAVRGPVAVLILLVLAIVVAAMVLDVPAGLWHQPALGELRAGVLEAIGLPTPQPG